MAQLIFDGDCGFCKKIVRWISANAEASLKVAPYQEAFKEHPEISKSQFENSVFLIDDDRKILSGAAAIFRALQLIRGMGWLFYVYQYLPGFKPISERSYKFVAEHRPFFSKTTQILWGDDFTSSVFLVRWLFLKTLALVYFTAFISMLLQVKGLIGADGIMPAKDFLQSVGAWLGNDKWFLLPTIAWFSSTNTALIAYCGAGLVFSVLLFFEILPVLSCLLLWFLYLSFVQIGSEFMQFQWDNLLLEAGFIAVFLAPSHKQPSKIVVWIFRFLVFRLLISSGLSKLTSGDENWKNLTALQFHFETQPLPTWIGYYFHQLPTLFQKANTALTLFLELIIPIFFFFPRRVRIFAFWFEISFQILIILTGNYTFFNYLTMGLCLFLLDDTYLKTFFKQKFKRLHKTKVYSLRLAYLAGFFAIFSVTAGTYQILEFFNISPGIFSPVVKLGLQTRTVNGYGLFAVMTTTRHEIQIEGSADGTHWLPYEFKFKPGGLSRRPAFVAPYQPRIDWQAWFAALGEFKNQTWLQNLLVRLMQGKNDVIALFENNPFNEKPPQFMRVMLYDYHFTDLSTKRTTGHWWRRELIGPYSPVVELPIASVSKGR